MLLGEEEKGYKKLQAGGSLKGCGEQQGGEGGSLSVGEPGTQSTQQKKGGRRWRQGEEYNQKKNFPRLPRKGKKGQGKRGGSFWPL